jgi:hypothetical protein
MRAYAGSAPVCCCSPQLPVSHISSPSIADKVALLTFPNRNGFRAGGDSSQTTSCCWLPNKEHTELGMVRRGQWQKSTEFTHYPRGLPKSSTPKLSLCCLELRSHMPWAIFCLIMWSSTFPLHVQKLLRASLVHLQSYRISFASPQPSSHIVMLRS